MLGWRYKDTDPSKFVGWGYQNPTNLFTLTLNTVAKTGFGTPVFFPWKHHERILCPDEFPPMRIKLADDLKLRPKEWSILPYIYIYILLTTIIDYYSSRMINWNTEQYLDKDNLILTRYLLHFFFLSSFSFSLSLFKFSSTKKNHIYNLYCISYTLSFRR